VVNHPHRGRRIFERGPGHDWTITYDAGEGVQIMGVYGVLTIEEAVNECRSSFGPEDQAELIVLAASRDPLPR